MLPDWRVWDFPFCSAAVGNQSVREVYRGLSLCPSGSRLGVRAEPRVRPKTRQHRASVVSWPCRSEELIPRKVPWNWQVLERHPTVTDRHRHGITAISITKLNWPDYFCTSLCVTIRSPFHPVPAAHSELLVCLLGNPSDRSGEAPCGPVPRCGGFHWTVVSTHRQRVAVLTAFPLSCKNTPTPAWLSWNFTK